MQSQEVDVAWKKVKKWNFILFTLEEYVVYLI